jgi:hypothetical protein
MRSLLPWARTAIALPAGVIAIELFHKFGEVVLPSLYASDLSNTTDRIRFMVAIVLAGITGAFTVGFIARHRPYLHMLLFLLVMIVIDVKAVMEYFPDQPNWFKAAIFLTMPLQLYLGGLMAKCTYKNAHAPAA